MFTIADYAEKLAKCLEKQIPLRYFHLNTAFLHSLLTECSMDMVSMVAEGFGMIEMHKILALFALFLLAVVTKAASSKKQKNSPFILHE